MKKVIMLSMFMFMNTQQIFTSNSAREDKGQSFSLISLAGHFLPVFAASHNDEKIRLKSGRRKHKRIPQNSSSGAIGHQTPLSYVRHFIFGNRRSDHNTAQTK